MILKTLFLCDYASSHQDNTFSVLRGGIDRVNIANDNNPEGKSVQPRPINIALVATLELEMTEMGRLHNLQLSFLNADGKRMLPDLMSHFQTPPSSEKRRHNVILNASIPPLPTGEYAFYVNVDGHELGSHPFYVMYSQTK